jgi:hypothetical protein
MSVRFKIGLSEYVSAAGETFSQCFVTVQEHFIAYYSYRLFRLLLSPYIIGGMW